MAEENVITIDGTEYTNADLSNEQKYLIAQIKDLQTKYWLVKWIKEPSAAHISA